MLYVRKFCFNLISVSKLIKDLNCYVWFDTHGCYVQGSLMKKHLPLGKAAHSLYFLQDQKNNTSQRHKDNTTTCIPIAAVHNKNQSSGCKDARLWHIRMGHLPFSQLYFLFPDLQPRALHKECFCTICPLAKKARDPFTRSSTKTVEPFQLVHIDLWGLLMHNSRIKCKRPRALLLL